MVSIFHTCNTGAEPLCFCDGTLACELFWPLPALPLCPLAAASAPPCAGWRVPAALSAQPVAPSPPPAAAGTSSGPGPPPHAAYGSDHHAPAKPRQQEVGGGRETASMCLQINPGQNRQTDAYAQKQVSMRQLTIILVKWTLKKVWMFEVVSGSSRILLYYLLQSADGLCLVINDFGFNFEGIILPLILFPLSLQLSAQHLYPGLQAPAVLSQWCS